MVTRTWHSSPLWFLLPYWSESSSQIRWRQLPFSASSPLLWVSCFHQLHLSFQWCHHPFALFASLCSISLLFDIHKQQYFTLIPHVVTLTMFSLSFHFLSSFDFISCCQGDFSPSGSSHQGWCNSFTWRCFTIWCTPCSLHLLFPWVLLLQLHLRYSSLLPKATTPTPSLPQVMLWARFL